jgi:hypothetical protein
MAGNFTADVRNWTEKAKRNVDLVLRGSAQDVSELASIAKDGLVRGAPFEVGVVPVDQGQLIGSIVVEIDGAIVGSGSLGQAPDYTAALAGFEAGEIMQLSFTAPYARIIEYGRQGVPGRFFVRNAAQQWPAIVEANAALFKD